MTPPRVFFVLVEIFLTNSAGPNAGLDQSDSSGGVARVSFQGVVPGMYFRPLVVVPG